MQSIVTDDISAVQEALSRQIGAQKYRIWFKNSTRFEVTDGYLLIGVPNQFIAGWLENHFSGEIVAAAKEALGSSRKLTFTIDPELSGHQRRSQLDVQAKQSHGDCASRKVFKRQPVRSKRLKLTLDSFVVGQSNELAYNAACVVAREEKSPFNPLFVHGGYGVGKTHILQGICNEVSKCRPGTNWLYLSAEDFANQFILALKTKKLEAFRHRMRKTDLLAIDDIHFLASKPSTQEEFLHTFNSIDLAGKQVILVSDAHPKMIGQLSDKLVNRFVSGMVVKVDSPDEETRMGICRRFVRENNANVSEPVLRYVAENMRTNVRELEGALLKLVAYGSLCGGKVTLSTAQDVLSEHLARTDPMVHVSDIEAQVATFFGITPADIHSSRKDRTVSMARHFSMYLARKLTKMSSPEIGRCIGKKNHATVLLACRRVEEYLENNKTLRWNGVTGNRVERAKTVYNKLRKSISV
jgi:chromosomal replication initiator protein